MYLFLYTACIQEKSEQGVKLMHSNPESRNTPYYLHYLKQIISALYLLIFLPCILTTGCQQLKTIPVKTGTSAFHEARHAFFQGNYSFAREKFYLLQLEGADPVEKCKGRYGIACINMITSKNSLEFFKAVEQLEKNRTSGKSMDVFDPDMLIEAFNHGIELMKKTNKNLNSRITALKSKNKIQNTKITEMLKQLHILEHQIATLESIDQKQQEKRNNQ